MPELSELPESSKTKTTGYSGVNTRTTLDQLIKNVMSTEPAPLRKPNLSGPASANSAVASCCQAYSNVLEAVIQRGKSRFAAETEARLAFRNAMPPLTGAQNIRDFIACVAHAMLIEVIPAPDGTRLLYAAQVAYSTIDTRQHRPTQASAVKPTPTAP